MFLNVFTMNIYNYLVLTATAIPLLLSIVFSGLVVSPAIAQAQTDALSCPIDSALAIWLNGSEEVLEVNDFLSLSATMVNNSSYTLGGVLVGVAIYDRSEKLSHWMVLDEERQLPPQTTIEIPVDLNLATLDAGFYKIAVYVMQGDETALLGSMLNGSIQPIKFLTIKKLSEQKAATTISISVNEEKFTGQPIVLTKVEPLTVTIVTKNESPVPLLESSMLAVLAEGEVPLGTAVREDKLDSVKLIPKGTRTTVLKDVLANGGTHTVYAALVTKGTVQPVVKVPVIVGEETTGAWSYISQIGLSDYPVRTDSQIVACVGTFGENSVQGRFAEPLGLTFEVEREGKILTTETIYTSDVATNNFVSYVPGMVVKDFSVKVALLQNRFHVPHVEGSEASLEQMMKESMTEIDAVSLVFQCNNEEECALQTEVAADEEFPVDQESFWFYAAIVIAAALLMYLMLRRLDPVTVDSKKDKTLSANELQ